MASMAKLDWMSYRDTVDTGEAIMFKPIGALEQHGPYMSMNPDVLIPEAIAEGATDLLENALVAPPIEKLYPDGFTGWDIEPGGVLETSLMLHLYPDLVNIDKIIDHPPATFPPYDMFPVDPALTPASGTLSSAKNATKEKGEILMDVCVSGIAKAVKEKFQ